jgi:hypothetical protein
MLPSQTGQAILHGDSIVKFSIHQQTHRAFLSDIAEPGIGLDGEIVQISKNSDEMNGFLFIWSTVRRGELHPDNNDLCILIA